MKSHHALLALGMMLVCISLVSAEQLNISPSVITFNAHPGEIIVKNLTVTTDALRAINFSTNISSNKSFVNLTISGLEPQAINGVKNISVSFQLSGDSYIQSFRITITGVTTSDETIIVPEIVNHYYGGGGSWANPIVKNQTINNSNIGKWDPSGDKDAEEIYNNPLVLNNSDKIVQNTNSSKLSDDLFDIFKSGSDAIKNTFGLIVHVIKAIFGWFVK